MATGKRNTRPASNRLSDRPTYRGRPKVRVPGAVVNNRRAPQDLGVVVSVGPIAPSHNRFVKGWMTFPLTPESIPVQHTGNWNDVSIVGLGEVPHFVGRALDTLQFSGILEPPKYYVGATTYGLNPVRSSIPRTDYFVADGVQTTFTLTGGPALNGSVQVFVGGASSARLGAWLSDADLSSPRGDYCSLVSFVSPPASGATIRVNYMKYDKAVGDAEQFGPLDEARENDAQFRDRLPTWTLDSQGRATASGTERGIPPLVTANNTQLRAVMEDGARAGPNNYYEPHAFKNIMENCAKSGERMRLCVGDDYGWYGIAVVRDFSWRYEDPDPDVLYFDITFREYREPALKGTTTRKEPTQTTYLTKDGDTLKKIALYQYGDPTKWELLRNINYAQIAKLWYYRKDDKPVKTRGDSDADPGSVGHKIAGKKYGFQIGYGKTNLAPGVSPDFIDDVSGAFQGDQPPSEYYLYRDQKNHFDMRDFDGDIKFRAGVRILLRPREASKERLPSDERFSGGKAASIAERVELGSDLGGLA